MDSGPLPYTSPGTSADFAMRLALKGVGLSYKDIQAVTVGGAPARNAAVITGRVDFTVAIYGKTRRRIKRQALRSLYRWPSSKSLFSFLAL